MQILSIIIVLMTLISPLHAASFEKKAEFKRGEVSEFDVAGINYGHSDLYVVGVINSRRNLMLFVYSGAEKTPRSQVELGEASSISLSAIGGNGERRLVSAMRDSDGKLRVIGWSVSSDGRTLTRLGTRVGPSIKSVSAGSSGFGSLRIAGKLANDNLFLRGVALSASGSVSFSTAQTFGGVKDVELASGAPGAIAMRIRDDTFRISSVNSVGHSGVERGSTTLVGGEVTDLAITSVDSGTTGRWVTITSSAYVETNSWFRPGHCLNAPHVIPVRPIGRGKLIAWDQDNVVQTNLSRLAEYEFSGRQGLAHEVEIVGFSPLNASWFITAHLGYSKPCGFKPRVEFHLWELDEDSGFKKLASTKLGGDYQDIEMTLIKGPATSGTARFVAVTRGRVSRALKVTVWEAQR